MGLFSRVTGTGRSSPPDTVNIRQPGIQGEPVPLLRTAAAESPVHRVTLPTRETAWLITRYDDVAAVLKDERFVKDTANALTPEQAARQPWFRKIFKSLKRNLLNQDPPVHTRLRALVNKTFTPRLVEQIARADAEPGRRPPGRGTRSRTQVDPDP